MTLPKKEVDQMFEEQKAHIHAKYFQNKDNKDFQLFIHVCKTRKLDGLMGQIHPVFRPAKQKDGSYKQVMTIQTGIDGYRLLADRTGTYAPGRAIEYTYNKDGRVESATAYVKKMTKDGTWHEVPATAFFDEYVKVNKDGSYADFWMRMPKGQLGKCAEALAIRKANPSDLYGIYTTDEMAQADFDLIEEELNDIRAEMKTLADEVVPKVLITKEQADQIDFLLSQFSPERKEKCLGWIESLGFKEIAEITEDKFLNIKTKIDLGLENIKQMTSKQD